MSAKETFLNVHEKLMTFACSLYCISVSISLSGGIELNVFSDHFKVELDVVDIQSQRVDRFGNFLLWRCLNFCQKIKNFQYMIVYYLLLEFFFLHSGEGDKFERRALLLYDGIHYDPLVLMDGSGTTLQTNFPISNEAVLFEALDIAKQAHKVENTIYCVSLLCQMYDVLHYTRRLLFYA